MMSSGHLRRAEAMVSAVTTPDFFAGVDFARIMPCRELTSPPTAEGISRRSCAPGYREIRYTDSQHKKAEFTSI